MLTRKLVFIAFRNKHFLCLFARNIISIMRYRPTVQGYIIYFLFNVIDDIGVEIIAMHYGIVWGGKTKSIPTRFAINLVGILT